MNAASPGDSVIVVGAGVVGIACAHYLSNAGYEVTVIDQSQIGGACSYANCGYISPSHVPPLTEPGAIQIALKSLFNRRSPFRVKPTLNPSVLNWMWQFARRCNHQQVLQAGKHLQSILDASQVEYKQVIESCQLQCEWQTTGLLYVYEHQHAFDEYAAVDQMLTENFGVSARAISGKDLPNLDPGLKDGLYGAFHYTGDASLRPDLLTKEWSEYLIQRGVKFVSNCQVTDVQMNANRLEIVKASCGNFKADHFVFALGAWSSLWSKKLHCKIPILPGKGYSVTLDRPQNCPVYPMLFPEHKVGVSPFQNSMRLGSMMEFVGYDTRIPDYRIQQLRDSARHYLVADVDGPAQEKWYGWRPMTWDSLPIIGRLPKVNNCLLATGHNMLGMSLATSTGRLIAEILAGTSPHIDPAPYSPLRFTSTKSFA